MNYLILVLGLSSFGAFASDGNLQRLKVDASASIQRELKALRSSQSCIDTAASLKEFQDCDYDHKNFNSQKQETPDTGATTEKIRNSGACF